MDHSVAPMRSAEMLARAPSSDLRTVGTYLAPPHALIENRAGYSIVFNMFGIMAEDVAIQVNDEKREVTVAARKVSESLRKGFFWIFGTPADAALGRMIVRFCGGVLEISIPKRHFAEGA